MYKQLKVAFFCEAGKKRGLGHLIRSYTIYSEFILQNFECSFFVDTDINLSDKFISVKTFTWNTFSINHKYDIIFIDSYEADINVYNMISISCKVAIYIDDYKRFDYPRGIILNFSPDADKLLYNIKLSKHTYLLGTKYIPLRKLFLTSKEEKESLLFIMLGGNDNSKLLYSISNALSDLHINKIIVTQNKELKKQLLKLKNTKVLYQPTDKTLISTMKQSSIAITTASMSLYELNFLNIPNIIIATSKNQKFGAESLIKYKLASKYVDIDQVNYLDILRYNLQELIDNKDFNKIENIIDGLGTKRIMQTILKVLR